MQLLLNVTLGGTICRIGIHNYCVSVTVAVNAF